MMMRSEMLGLGLALAVSLTATQAYADQPEDVESTQVDSEEEAEDTPSPDPAPKHTGKKKKKKKKKKVKKPKKTSATPRETAQAEPWQYGQNGNYESPAYSCPGCIDGGKARRMPYHESMDVPDGYHLEETPRYGLIAAGISMTATLWLVSTVSAIVLDKEASENGDPNFDDMYWPMFIPVAGPFVAIGTADSSGTGAAILALDGVVQLAGVAMVIGGFAAPTVELVEDYKITISPTAAGSETGMSLGGSF